MLSAGFVLAAAAVVCDAKAAAVREVGAVATGIVEADNAAALDRVLDYYAPEAVLLPPGQPPVVGKASLRPRYEAMFAAFAPAIVARVDEACVSGRLAFVRGHNGGRLAARKDGGDQVLNDPYLMLLARGADGAWRITHLMWHRMSEPPPSTADSAAWERLKSLAGDWTGTYEGQPAGVSYRLVSGGTALQETLDVAVDDSHMTTIYHPDGASVLMTHYCDMGNQPRMRAAVLQGGRLEFAYVDASNLKSPDDLVMSRLVMTFPAADRLVQEWTSRKSGREQTGRFEFTRKRGAER
ncbi:MAG TPA: nuclear transport factor 2 family protein, partial [Vicinamibacteria bacterium]|jgi:ketosteroid isomerase-like protein